MNSRIYFFVLFGGSFILNLLCGAVDDAYPHTPWYLRDFARFYENVLLAFFPFCLYAVLVLKMPAIAQHVLIGILACLTAWVMGAKQEKTRRLIFKVVLYLSVSLVSYYLSVCYFFHCPPFPPSLSLGDLLDLAAGK